MINMKQKRGVIIVVEGLDGAGKTTQAKKLKEWLESKGFTVVLLKEPTDGDYGRKIREKLNKNGKINQFEMAKLYALDRLENVKKNVQPALNRGDIIIIDRYVPSSIVYQSINGPSESEILELNKFAPEPDVVIIIDITEDEAIRRMNASNRKQDAFEKREFLKKVREKYLTLPNTLKKLGKWQKTKFFIVDGMRNEEAVFEDIKMKIEKILGESK